MKRVSILFYIVLSLFGYADLGKEVLGSLQVDLVYATNAETNEFSKEVKSLTLREVRSLQEKEVLAYKKYYLLGSDQQDIYRSYENWASPLRPAEDILLRFEPEGEVTKDQTIRIDLEFWQQKRKVLATDQVLELQKPIYIMGPAWREGKLILIVRLSKLDL